MTDTSLTNERDQLLTTQEVADLLRVTVGTIYNLTSRRELPYMKIGDLLRFRRSELEQYLERKTEAAR